MEDRLLGRDIFGGSVALAVTDKREPLSRVPIVKIGTIESRNGTFVLDRAGLDQLLEDFRKHATPQDIDIEHISLNPEAPPNQRGAVGWIEDLVVEGDGLVAVVKWNADGQEAIRADRWRYFSPVFLLDPKNKQRIIGLRGGALTNKPALPGQRKLAASEQGNRSSRMSEESEKAKRTSGLIVQLAEKLGMRANAADPESSLDEMIAAAEKRNGALTALSSVKAALGLKEGDALEAMVPKIAALSANAARLETAEKELAVFRESTAKAQVKERLAPFVQANQISPAMLPHFEALAAKDWPQCEAICKTLPTLAPTAMSQAPAGGAPKTGASKEEELIANAVKEHKGKYVSAIESLQIELKQPFLVQGLTHRAANEACAEQYPKIFAAAC